MVWSPRVLTGGRSSEVIETCRNAASPNPEQSSDLGRFLPIGVAATSSDYVVEANEGSTRAIDNDSGNGARHTPQLKLDHAVLYCRRSMRDRNPEEPANQWQVTTHLSPPVRLSLLGRID